MKSDLAKELKAIMEKLRKENAEMRATFQQAPYEFGEDNLIYNARRHAWNHHSRLLEDLERAFFKMLVDAK